MSHRVSFFLAICALLVGTDLGAQESSPPRDSQGVAVLQQALAAMGGSVPADSVATGTVELVAGSKYERGAIRILTRGLDQTAEEVRTAEGDYPVVYSRIRAKGWDGETVRPFSLERAASSQSPCFPVVLLAAALNNADTAYSYLGIEQVGSMTAHRVRFWNSYASQGGLRRLAEFTVRDIWIDAATGLPLKLAFDQRDAGGSADRILIEVFFSDYRNVGGILFPFRIEKARNGVTWATIAIEQVQFNAGLSEEQFSVR